MESSCAEVQPSNTINLDNPQPADIHNPGHYHGNQQLIEVSFQGISRKRRLCPYDWYPRRQQNLHYNELPLFL